MGDIAYEAREGAGCLVQQRLLGFNSVVKMLTATKDVCNAKMELMIQTFVGDMKQTFIGVALY